VKNTWKTTPVWQMIELETCTQVHIQIKVAWGEKVTKWLPSVPSPEGCQVFEMVNGADRLAGDDTSVHAKPFLHELQRFI
jgi:hypothetical protein